MNIVLIEPTWPGLIHFPMNLGFANSVAEAYPNARITYVGSDDQSTMLHNSFVAKHKTRLSVIKWQVWEDKTNIFGDHIKRWKEFRKLPAELLASADAIILLSVTASALDYLVSQGYANKSYGFLHGNANELIGWRSRNPFRKATDLISACQRFTNANGTMLVLEKRIIDELTILLPWIKNKVDWIPHPLLEAEITTTRSHLPQRDKLVIGFAGNASKAKGFPEFVELANKFSHAGSDLKFEFHAVGLLRPECNKLDQSALTIRATNERAPRAEFTEKLSLFDFMFQWHSDDYYKLAASGVVYDAITMGIPLIARSGAEIEYQEQNGCPIAISAETLDGIFDQLNSSSLYDLTERHKTLSSNLTHLREQLSINNLVRHIHRVLKT